MRRITALLLALALAASLTACGGTDQPAAGSTPPAGQGENTPPAPPADTAPATAPVESAPAGSQPGSPEEPAPSEEPQPAIPEGAVVLYDGEHYIMPAENPYRERPAILLSGRRLEQDTVEFTQVQRKWDQEQRAFIQDITAFQTAFGGSTMGEQITWKMLDGSEGTDMTAGLDEVKDRIIYQEYGWAGPLLTGDIYAVNFTDAEIPLKDCSLIYLMVFCSSSEFHIQMDGRELEAVDDVAAVCGTPAAAFLMNGEPAYIWLFDDFCMVAPLYKGELSNIICFSLTDEAQAVLENYSDVITETLGVLSDLELI